MTSPSKTRTPNGVSSNEGIREQLIAVATSLFAQRGFHGTSMTEIENAVGRRRGTIYYHIDSKADLLAEICDRSTQDMVAAARRIAAKQQNAREALFGMVDLHVREILTHTDRMAVVMRDLRSLPGPDLRRIAKRRDEYEEIWVGILNQGAAGGQWRSVDSFDVKSILGMINYSILWLRPDGTLSTAEVVDRFVSLIEHGLGLPSQSEE